jgi:hypothetical protein
VPAVVKNIQEHSVLKLPVPELTKTGMRNEKEQERTFFSFFGQAVYPIDSE